MNTPADILYVVPPFSQIYMPCVGVHLLREVSNRLNKSSEIFYANIDFASYIGFKNYNYLVEELSTMYNQLGERLFARVAYKGFAHLGLNEGQTLESKEGKKIDLKFLLSLEKKATSWVYKISRRICACDYKIIAFSLGHQQTNAAVALANYIKATNPLVKIVFGGPSCDGEMAKGILTLSKSIDIVFSGEGEVVWHDFLKNPNYYPEKSVMYGAELKDLNLSPAPNYHDYFNQVEDFEIDPTKCWNLYESSRSCWHAQTQQCNFCGVNGSRVNYRFKSPDKIYNELHDILAGSPSKKILMVDTLMPRQYLSTLLPCIKKRFPYVTFFYEQRADLNFDQVRRLKEYGMSFTQVGIESFSTHILTLINKGITATQNIQLLRYAKSVGCIIGWNFLIGVPNDKKDDWDKMIKLLPHLIHLNPPLGLRNVEVVKFSPYYMRPVDFNIKNLKPLSVYYQIFPENSDISSLAWAYDCDFLSYSKNQVVFNTVATLIKSWQARWHVKIKDIPKLNISKEKDNYYILDTRYCRNSAKKPISYSMAKICILGVGQDSNDIVLQDCLDKRYLVEHENELIPLATADQSIFDEFFPKEE